MTHPDYESPEFKARAAAADRRRRARMARLIITRRCSRRLCPTCGRRCIGFNLNGRCENKRYRK